MTIINLVFKINLFILVQNHPPAEYPSKTIPTEQEFFPAQPSNLVQKASTC
jgi:hypothetical protein